MKSINQTLVNALMALSIVGAASCSSAGDPVASDQESPVGVVTALPAVSPSGAISFSGRVESEQTAYISTRVMGAIEKIHVREGDKVLAGQLLVSISNQDLMARRVQAEAAVAEAEAAWNVAQKDQQRFKTLFEQQSVSPKELENVTLQARSAQSRYESATQMLRELEVSLGYTRLKAPFSGVITRKMVDEGSMANPGMPLLILEQGGKLRVSATIPESEIAHVQRGDRVQMTVKSSGKVFPGTILLISPSSQGTGGHIW
jgi:RND family efflux transporter MFP subunit